MGACSSAFLGCHDLLIPEEQRTKLWYKILHGLFCVVAVLTFLYFFLVGLDLMGNSFKILAGDSAGSLFGAVDNPIAGLMIGILVTVLLQSSSTTTSIIVSAVGSGLITVQQGIPMIFGANIGTSVTNTIVSMGFAGDKEQYRRGFAGATVHDMFNYMNVLFWLPIELISDAINGGNGGVLFLLSEACAKTFDACEGDDCEKWEGPLKVITGGLTSLIIKVDKDVIKDFSKGRPESDMCQFLCDTAKCTYKFSRKQCTEYATAAFDTVCGNYLDVNQTEKVKAKTKAKFTFCEFNATTDSYMIDEQTLADAQAHYDAYKLNKAGALYELGWQKGAGVFTLVMSLIIMIICLVSLVKLLSYVVRGPAESVVKRALDINGYLAILVGCGITVFVQSSSITTSVLTPLVAIGVLRIEKMFPLTLGANIGTTFTGILASLVGDSSFGFQIAMVHFFFNVFGVILFYPIPFIRRIPINAALVLGDVAAAFRPFPIVYIVMAFFVYPGFILLVSIGIESGNTGAVVGCSLALVIFALFHAYIIYWFKKLGGREKVKAWIKRRNLGHEDVSKDNGDDGDNQSDPEQGSQELHSTDDDDDEPFQSQTSMNEIHVDEKPTTGAQVAVM